MKLKYSLFLACFILLSCFQNVYADDNRMNQRWGIYGSVIGDPLVAIPGINLAYNASDYLRLTGGFGIFPTAYGLITSAVVGVKFLAPHLEFSPVAGLNLSGIFLSGITYEGLPYDSYHLVSDPEPLGYANFGFDYQAKDGFDLGAGVDIPFVSPTAPIPGLNMGKFF